MYCDVFISTVNVMNTIVFVEDDAEVGSLIAAYLAKHDMQVTVEPRGDQAEETILRENPDLVLLDIMLPGKDGMTICRDLRAKWSGPIVLLTSLDSDILQRFYQIFFLTHGQRHQYDRLPALLVHRLLFL